MRQLFWTEVLGTRRQGTFTSNEGRERKCWQRPVLPRRQWSGTRLSPSVCSVPDRRLPGPSEDWWCQRRDHFRQGCKSVKKSCQNRDCFKTANYALMNSDIMIPFPGPTWEGTTLGPSCSDKVCCWVRHEGALMRSLPLRLPPTRVCADMAKRTLLS